VQDEQSELVVKNWDHKEIQEPRVAVVVALLLLLIPLVFLYVALKR
jgi:hypothetical protein